MPQIIGVGNLSWKEMFETTKFTEIINASLILIVYFIFIKY